MYIRKPRILVVDDKPDIVAVLRDFLVQKGCEVTTAFDGESALGILKKEKADLVLLDIKMPGLSGTEVAKIIKENYPDTKLVILTGFPATAEELLKGHILEDILIKPIKMQGLFDRLLEILGWEEGATPDGKATQDLKKSAKRPIKARVLLIKAKLLFIESNAKIYNFLNRHFKSFSAMGEYYETEQVNAKEAIFEKSMSFRPDIYLANASFMKEDSKSIISYIPEKDFPMAEIILYNADEADNINKAELENITKGVKTTCLKYGFIDVKWIEI